MYNLIELLVRGKQSRSFQRAKSYKCTRKQTVLVINERAWTSISGKLFRELQPDHALAALSAIKEFAWEQ